MRSKKMCLGTVHGDKDGVDGMSAMSVEPAGSGAALPTPVSDAQKHFLHLALVVANHLPDCRRFFLRDLRRRSSSTFSQTRPSLHPNALGPITRRRPAVLQSSWPRHVPGRATPRGMRKGRCFGANRCPSRGPPWPTRSSALRASSSPVYIRCAMSRSGRSARMRRLFGRV